MERFHNFLIIVSVILILTVFASLPHSRAAIFEGTETTEGVQFGLCLDNPEATECAGVDCDSPEEVANPLCISESQAGTGLAKTSLTGTGITHTENFGDYIKKLVNFALPYLTLAAFLGYVVAGFLYVTAFGVEAQMEKAKKILIWSSIGLILIILSYAITNLLTSELVQGLAG